MELGWRNLAVCDFSIFVITYVEEDGFVTDGESAGPLATRSTTRFFCPPRDPLRTPPNPLALLFLNLGEDYCESG